MHGWQVALGNDSNKISFLVDPDATFAKAFGVDREYHECSLGLRSKRFSMIVSNGIVNSFKIVEDAAKDAEELLKELRDIRENEDFLQEAVVEG
jgi:peroxiredoxin